MDLEWNGDPELLTLKALRLIRENPVIAVPGNDIKSQCRLSDRKRSISKLDEKELIPVAMPMTKDRAVLEDNHNKAADAVESYLKQEKCGVSDTGRSYYIFHLSVCT